MFVFCCGVSVACAWQTWLVLGKRGLRQWQSFCCNWNHLLIERLENRDFCKCGMLLQLPSMTTIQTNYDSSKSKNPLKYFLVPGIQVAPFRKPYDL